jgi:DNA polymerase-3 subunit gamma/tau
MTEALHIRHRPKRFEDVIGNRAEVRAFSEAIKLAEAHAYLLSGPSGLGKTTLARIAAKVLGAKGDGLNEIDAATFTGIEDMRAIKDLTRYRPFEAPVRCIIMDECHSLSAKAWESLLKSVEEPPDHVFWFFCSTQPGKVPNTIRTRCMHTALSALPVEQVEEVLDKVIAAESIQLPDRVGTLIAKAANGSPRQALVYLAKVESAKSTASAAAMLQSAEESEPLIAFCRYLIGKEKRSWARVIELLTPLDKTNPESVRIMVCNYIAGALKRSRNDSEAIFLLNVLDAFSVSYNASENAAPLYLSTGRIIYADK